MMFSQHSSTLHRERGAYLLKGDCSRWYIFGVPGTSGLYSIIFHDSPVDCEIRVGGQTVFVIKHIEPLEVELFDRPLDPRAIYWHSVDVITDNQFSITCSSVDTNLPCEPKSLDPLRRYKPLWFDVYVANPQFFRHSWREEKASLPIVVTCNEMMRLEKFTSAEQIICAIQKWLSEDPLEAAEDVIVTPEQERWIARIVDAAALTETLSRPSFRLLIPSLRLFSDSQQSAAKVRHFDVARDIDNAMRQK